MSVFSPVDVLAVGAHPDDVELGCGGTILKLVQLGRKVGVIDLTRGELGTRGDPQTRAREADSAAQILGLTFRANLAMRDGSVRADDPSRLEIVRALRECRPALVLTHSAHGHPDHWETAKLIRESSHHSGLTRIDTGRERFRPTLLGHWLEYTQPVVPDVVVDISSFYDGKEQAVRAYASQLQNKDSEDPETYLSRPGFLDQLRSHCRYLGNISGCDYAEGFVLSRVPRIVDLTEI